MVNRLWLVTSLLVARLLGGEVTGNPFTPWYIVAPKTTTHQHQCVSVQIYFVPSRTADVESPD